MTYRWLVYIIALGLLTGYWLMKGGVGLLFVPLNLYVIWWCSVRFREDHP